MHEIDDEYATCTGTYATLRITSKVLDPEQISTLIGFEPTRSFKKGEVRTQHPSAKSKTHAWSGWFYSTKELSHSRDCRRHLEVLLAGPLKDSSSLGQLRESGCETDVAVMYGYTQGGPTISPQQMLGLAEAGVEVWWDLYHEPEADE
ncbi:DUF4279 domain-containing protein [Corallincola spongiicola]|uniref:DUF4279 domain-containing protein n=1 Tax=Corallincola spongiicola TaxID=2520508 RepID=UPI0013EEBBFF|nr:DUF4279 domain-containing protein [Corallincola spongiicola]